MIAEGMNVSMSTSEDPRDEPAKRTLDILIMDYEASVSRLEQLGDRAIQVFGAGAAALGIVAGYTATQAAPASSTTPSGAPPPISGIDPVLAWLIPMIFVAFFALFLYIFHNIISYVYICRLQSIYINLLSKQTVLIQFLPETPSGVYFSLRRGNIKFRVNIYLLLAMAIAVSAYTMVVLTPIVYQNGNLQGNLFVFIYTSLFLMVLFAYTGVVRDLPNMYRDYTQKVQASGEFPAGLEVSRPIYSIFSWKDLFFVSLPRVIDVTRGINFWFGFGFAYIVLNGLQTPQLGLANQLFADKIPWMSASDVTIGAIIGIGIVYFVIEELILQQAKLLWDDIRDIDRDKNLLLNRTRAFAKGLMSRSQAVRHVVIRWALAMVLGALLGGFPLFILFGLISLHQALYILSVKNKGGERPVLLLTYLSFGAVFRYIAGTLALTKELFVDIRIFLPMAAVYLLYFGVVACYWRIEAIHYGKNHRKQSDYYRKNGIHWQRSVILASIVLILLNLYLEVGKFSSIINVYLFDIYSVIKIGDWLVLFTLVCLLSLLIVLLFRFLFWIFSDFLAMKSVNDIFIYGCYVSLAVVVIMTIYKSFNDAIFYHLLIVSILFLNLANLERITYLDYTLINIRRRLSMNIIIWGIYLFQSEHGMRFRDLIAYTISGVESKTIKPHIEAVQI